LAWDQGSTGYTAGATLAAATAPLPTLPAPANLRKLRRSVFAFSLSFFIRLSSSFQGREGRPEGRTGDRDFI